MSLKAKLQRLKGHLTREVKQAAEAVPQEWQQEPGSANRTGLPVESTVESTTVERMSDGSIPFLPEWTALAARPYIYHDRYVMVREVRYPLSQRHGRYRFAQLYEVIEDWERASADHPLSAANLAADALLFFDTETTGLNGGVGNTVFLLGYSRVEGDEVIVRQHFLAAPDAEVALYQSFLDSVREFSHLVTFNGKAFDWPQVKTRHTLIRDEVPQLPAFGHLDLLHGARRLWKHHLPSCRLSLIEQQKLGVWREEDVPGYMAPLAYFDYLNERDPRLIQGVLKHNERDVLSLITLYIHLSKLLLAHESSAVSPEELFETARWYEALGQWERAIQRYRAVAESCTGSGTQVGVNALIALGHLYKKQKKWQQAISIWEQCMATCSYLPEEVYLEAAKICEHQLKDYEKALHYAKQALSLRKKKSSLLRHKFSAELAAYQKRIERLEQKLFRLV
ncbi:MAG: ribonuclease H-like domain-containing protein [Brevibacillus sp.]|nr:ribonuclease H-like domain-containing protein [Brevibacillus sp.]